MLEQVARLGYASKAVIYATVGTLALLAATNRGGAITDPTGALRVVLARPFGTVLLVILAIGLCGYGAWRILDAFADPDRDGTSAGGLVTRIGNAIRGLFYGGVGLEAIQLLRGIRDNSGNGAELWTARLLSLPLGAVLVGIVGVIIIAYGISQVVDAVRGRGDEKVDWAKVRADLRTLLRRVSRFGVAVRGGLLVTIGFFLLRAAVENNPDQAADSRESLFRLGSLFEGRWFLVVIAIGVLAYAVDQAVHARYRRIRAVA